MDRMARQGSTKGETMKIDELTVSQEVAVGGRLVRGRRWWQSGVVSKLMGSWAVEVTIDFYRRPIRFGRNLKGVTSDFIIAPMDDVIRRAIKFGRQTIDPGWTDDGLRDECLQSMIRYPYRVAPAAQEARR